MSTIQVINLGHYANDGSGDDLRTAFAKVNANFALLGTDIPVSEAVNLNTHTYTSTRAVKSGSGPYYVAFAISPQLSPPQPNTYYYVTGNVNSNYNGQFKAGDTGVDHITIIYPTDPGIFVGDYTTTISQALGVFKDKNGTTLEFNSIKSSDTSIKLTQSLVDIDMSANVGVQLDPTQGKPALQGDLLLNNFVIRGANGTGDIDSTVNGIRVDVLNALVGLILQSNLYKVDFGTIVGNYSVVNMDLGLITTPIGNSLDFGTFS